MKKLLIVLAVVVMVVLGIVYISNIETKEEKVAKYNSCVSLEMSRYYKTIDPVIQLCARGEAVACKVANERIEQKRVEVERTCRLYLN